MYRSETSSCLKWKYVLSLFFFSYWYFIFVVDNFQGRVLSSFMICHQTLLIIRFLAPGDISFEWGSLSSFFRLPYNILWIIVYLCSFFYCIICICSINDFWLPSCQNVLTFVLWDRTFISKVLSLFNVLFLIHQFFSIYLCIYL